MMLGVLGGALLLAGEAHLAARRGPWLPDPPVTPDGYLAGPADPVDGSDPAEVVWLGDSTARGVGASALDGTLPVEVAVQLGRPVRLRVLARSGARVAEVLNGQLPQIAGQHPTDVFISVGTNDAMHLTLRSQFRRDYARLLAALPASVVRVVLLGVPDMGSTPRLPQPLRAVAGWWGRVLANDISDLAHRRNATYVDIAAGTGLEFRRQPERYFAADNYHPNDCGYRLWATVVAETVAQIIWVRLRRSDLCGHRDDVVGVARFVYSSSFLL